MTDLAFAKYLAGKLLNSGEDCCEMCALARKGDICDSIKLAEQTGGRLDYNVCFAGLRLYAEKHTNN